MKIVGRLFTASYALIAAFFWLCAVGLVVFAGVELWHGMNPTESFDLWKRFDSILEAIGMLTIGVAALELGQTVIEEEVRREEEVSAPTRVRRFLSRFLIVVVVALSVETLVAVFKFVHDDPGKLPQAAAIGVAAAALLAAWGAFVRLNTAAEALEPEAMERTKREDDSVQDD